MHTGGSRENADKEAIRPYRGVRIVERPLLRLPREEAGKGGEKVQAALGEEGERRMPTVRHRPSSEVEEKSSK